ncbi:phage major tail tube protein [Pseudomonas sp. B392_1p]|uniref:phage major tail tube protein n=1 Tax=Pseudomonas sp. B392_1p TaxID=3457507 RepID=UPI003FD12F0A
MAMIPETLFNMTMFLDGTNFAGDVLSVTLPKLKVKTEEHRAGGMDAPIDMDMGLEKLEAGFSCSGARSEVLGKFGLADQSAFFGNFRGAFKGQKGKVKKVIATFRGQLIEVDPGDWKPGDKAEFKYGVSLSYYKLEIDDTLVHEIDPANAVRVVNGVDQLAAVRTALGM